MRKVFEILEHLPYPLIRLKFEIHRIQRIGHIHKLFLTISYPIKTYVLVCLFVCLFV